MNKPIVFALAMFSALCAAALGRSYFKQDEINWPIEITAAVGSAVVAYAVAQWMQQRAQSQDETEDSGSQ